MSEIRLRYSLFTKFEDALINFRDALSVAKDYYQSIFEGLLHGKDMNKEVIDDAIFVKVQEQRFALQEEQHRISRIISQNPNAFFTLSTINEHIKDKFEIDIVVVGKECIELYEEVTRYTGAIEKFYRAKSDEYKAFFDSLYAIDDEKKENYEVASDGVTYKKNELDKQGVLIKARV